jgi:integrase
VVYDPVTAVVSNSVSSLWSGGGVVIQRRGSRWRVVVQAGRDPVTGRRRQLSGSAKTEREAVRLERALRVQAEGGATPLATLADVAEEWWATSPRLAATTRANYRDNLDCHILPVFGRRKVADIRPRLIAAFLRHLAEEKALSPGTIRRVRTVLSAVMHYAAAMEYVESNPVMKVPPPPLPPSSRVAPTVEEAARLLLEAERSDPEFLTYLWVAAEEGGRRGETLALRWAGVDFEASAITIDATVTAADDGVQVRPTTKNKRPRTIAVSAITLDLLGAHRRRLEELRASVGETAEIPPSSFVFSGGSGSRRHPLDGKPWRPDSTTRRFAKLKERAGVRAEIDLHGLRHTMVTELLVAGVDPRTVMGRAGHSSPTMTMSVYAKVRPVADAAAAEIWGRTLRDKMEELRAGSAPDVSTKSTSARRGTTTRRPRRKAGSSPVRHSS